MRCVRNTENEHFDHYEVASILKLMKDDTVLVAPETVDSNIQVELKEAP